MIFSNKYKSDRQIPIGRSLYMYLYYKIDGACNKSEILKYEKKTSCVLAISQ